MTDHAGVTRVDTPSGDRGSLSTLKNVRLHDREMLSRRLRLSLTDACNLGCFFCHNEGQSKPNERIQYIGISDYEQIVRAAVQAGIREVKLTGGEPLLYRDQDHGIVDLVTTLSELRVDTHFGLSLITNGIVFPQFSEQLKAAGLDRVTFSLHTINQQRFLTLISKTSSSRYSHTDILAGVRSAREAGFSPVKVNMVLFGYGIEGNTGELGEIVGLCRAYEVQQLRLYTLIKHQQFADHARWYRYWDRGLLADVAAAIFHSESARDEYVRDALHFVGASRGLLYPKPALVVDADGLEVSIEALESGRFDGKISDEGPYALRLSAAGLLSGVLEGPDSGVDIKPILARSDAHELLVDIFTAARREMLPQEA